MRDAGRQVRTLNYRTIRYPGHAAIMKALLHDLRLKDRRDVLKDILEQALPATMQDVVIVFVTVAGQRDGRLLQDTYARKIYSHVLAGKMRSAIQITTAASLCAMLDLLADRRACRRRGFVRQEDVPLADFLATASAGSTRWTSSPTPLDPARRPQALGAVATRHDVPYRT